MRRAHSTLPAIQAATGMAESTLYKLFRENKVRQPKQVRNKHDTNNLLLSYSKDERVAKDYLEWYFGRVFNKARFGGTLIDFVCEDLVLLVSWSHEADYRAAKRFAVVSSFEDTRRRIAYLVKTDGVAARRLEQLNVEVFDRQLIDLKVEP